MILDLVFRNLNKFKQPYNKDLYQKLIQEESKEFNEAKTDKEKVKEAVDLVWMSLGFLWSVFKGDRNKVLRLFKEVFISNQSKVCKTEEEAKQTIANYVNNTSKDYSEEDFYYRSYTDDEGEYFIVYTRDGKYKKGINYSKANLDWLDEEFNKDNES